MKAVFHHPNIPRRNVHSNCMSTYFLFIFVPLQRLSSSFLTSPENLDIITTAWTLRLRISTISTVCDVLIKTYLESFRYSSAVPGKAESRRFLPGRPFLVFSFSSSPFIISCFLSPNLFQLRQHECSLRRRDGALPEAFQQLPAGSPGIWFRLSRPTAMADTVSTGPPCLNQTV